MSEANERTETVRTKLHSAIRKGKSIEQERNELKQQAEALESDKKALETATGKLPEEEPSRAADGEGSSSKAVEAAADPGRDALATTCRTSTRAAPRRSPRCASSPQRRRPL